ncbi:HAUS augmin-like complex subunit 6 N-terminus-domain-containing protein [Chaetomium strumarium]|uniref:HAUS augmin-like complex subunit 6 N-terminus-domain-containing protein n=1 Tax=Chaetomium strumarium TaxID=1170767 RepID=A0AAJ0GV66_9PEZI|nr:HAUS augmin-like complex subunit 6 N-terminus-domain-containing protein [Chaetomium strumarium]
MAHLNGTSSLSRARSTRDPANAGKPPVQNSSRGGTPGVISSTTTASPTAPSNISLFLTNLRLLDLDLRPDWPDINALTFSTKDAAQGQKKRIQSVEWALYHLFVLWDPDEARNKLKPFFPPLDQVQSLNLRAALLRALEQAKKSGVLGRDAVVRKTMLDECKGERLEEVLAVFSSAVLKKLVAEQRLNGGGYPALAQALALENRGYSAERSELAALVLAHRVSLRRVLDGKNAARTRFSSFSGVLDAKEKILARRRELAEAAKQSKRANVISDNQKSTVSRAVRNNWTGNERWMEALLYGDSKSRKDGILSAPFDRVWRRVQSGRLAELEDTSVGLLEQLDSRVRGQQERLEKWQGFRQRMFGKFGSAPATQEPQTQHTRKGIDLGFRAHENLHLGRMDRRKLPRAQHNLLDSHYQSLIDGLKSDLAGNGQAASRIPSFFRRPRQTEGFASRTAEGAEAESEEISDISELEDAPPLLRPSPSRRQTIRVSEEPAFEPVLRKAKTFDDEHGAWEDESVSPSRPRRSATIQSHSTSAAMRPAQPSLIRDRAPKPNSPPSSPKARSPPRLAAASLEPPSSPEPPPSPTQELADQILASVSAASPSPVKKPRRALSLAERTRLSMARRTSHANLRVPADEDGMDEEPEADPLPLKRSSVTVPIIAEPPEAAQDGTDGGEGYEDLASRTRRSMAGYEAARQKAQLERRRSLRKSKLPPPTTPGTGRSSYFPTVDEEEGNSTLLLAEKLMSGEAQDDYEAVFMSRPKLKSSPVGTPVRELWGE